MKILISIFSLMALTTATSASARDHVNVVCSTTIKCANGIVTCSAEPEKSGVTSSEEATCGTVVRKYRTCSWSGFVETVGKVVKREKFICCSVNGDAISTNEKASAEDLCASVGTVQ